MANAAADVSHAAGARKFIRSLLFYATKMLIHKSREGWDFWLEMIYVSVFLIYIPHTSVA